jgi:hypothetical protein
MRARKRAGAKEGASATQLKKEERGRRIVARVMANKKFMAGVKEGQESLRLGEGVRFEDLKRKDA